MTAKLPRSHLGQYRLLKKVGIGGMGTVYLAEDTRDGQQVALKVPRFEAKEGSSVLERFSREARLASSIDHPHVCPVYDHGQVDGIPYLTMPYIEGSPLARRLNTEGPWQPLEALILARTLAKALQVLHEKGIVHRDLKPSNIIIRPDGEPMIMDFGLARSYTEATKQLTAMGVALGTPAYMAPEQILEKGLIGPGTDVYALGVILYESLTGEVPFEGTPTALFGQILHATPAPPSQHLPELEKRLDALCLRALAKKPSERFASMTEFAAALDVEIAALTPRPEPPRTVKPRRQLAGRVICPACGKKLKVPAEAEGRSLFCPQCLTAVGVSDEAFWFQRPVFLMAVVLGLLLLAGMAFALLLKAHLLFAACWVGVLLLGALVLMVARRGAEGEEGSDTPGELAAFRLSDSPAPPKKEPQSGEVESAAHASNE